jgi:ubiquinone/menaquinone biosynthesis C-methylase UbiE
MVHLARRRLRATGASYPLVLADVTRLPVKSASINTVVMTFPATFMRSALTYREVRRVLPPGGRWVLADNGRLLGRDPWSRLCNFAFRVAASAPGTGSGHFAAAGFTTMTHSVRFRRSLVEVVVATA